MFRYTCHDSDNTDYILNTNLFIVINLENAKYRIYFINFYSEPVHFQPILLNPLELCVKLIEFPPPSDFDIPT